MSQDRARQRGKPGGLQPPLHRHAILRQTNQPRGRSRVREPAPLELVGDLGVAPGPARQLLPPVPHQPLARIEVIQEPEVVEELERPALVALVGHSRDERLPRVVSLLLVGLGPPGILVGDGQDPRRHTGIGSWRWSDALEQAVLRRPELLASVTNVFQRYLGPPTTSTNPNMWSLIEWTRFMQITRKRPVLSNLY